MNKRNTVSLVAVIAMAMVLPAIAVPQPWPEAHSGAYLGVGIAAVNPQQASSLKLSDASGAVITYVDQDGPACHAGLKENDVVVAYEGSKVDNPQQLQGLIHATPPNKTVTMTVLRAGQRKDVKVTLGSWNIMSHANTLPAIALGAPAPPRAIMPDMEVPSFTLLSARHGLVVESLSPQLADFFGVQRGHGVLVRSVESGSPAAAAGLKAGDVILKVNDEVVHDMADWQRGMRAAGAKVPVTVLRDKREQSFTMALPNPGDNSRLSPTGPFDGSSGNELANEMEQLGPEIDGAQQEFAANFGPNEKELEQMRREVEKSRKQIEKMSREWAKSAKPFAKDMAKMQTEWQKSMPSQKDFEEMQRQIRESMPNGEQLKAQIQASMPTQKEFDQMRKQMDESMKSFGPEFQKQMDDLKKQMQDFKFDGLGCNCDDK